MASKAVYPSLADRAVLITGGATGIGEAFVRAFAAQGCKVGFLDIDEGNGVKLSTELRETSKHAPCFVRADVTDIENLTQGISKLREITGPFSVLVNNAANDVRHSIEDVTSDFFDQAVKVNLKHQFFAAQAVVPDMKDMGGGSIINLGSVSWKLGLPNLAIYQACKAGVHGLTRALAKDLGKDRIRVNTIIPGWVFTEKQLRLWATPEALANLEKDQLLPGKIAPEDIAAMALFLAADDSRFATSQEFQIDGGWW